jgi:hypothetical protein
MARNANQKRGTDHHTLISKITSKNLKSELPLEPWGSLPQSWSDVGQI